MQNRLRKNKLKKYNYSFTLHIERVGNVRKKGDFLQALCMWLLMSTCTVRSDVSGTPPFTLCKKGTTEEEFED